MQANNAISGARYLEDLLEKAVVHGVKQYVILGAGMDTFVFRRPEIVERLKVFGIDHPATQDFKRRRITELGWAKPGQLHFIPVDFTQEGLAKRLTSASYDPEAMSLNENLSPSDIEGRYFNSGKNNYHAHKKDMAMWHSINSLSFFFMSVKKTPSLRVGSPGLQLRQQ